MEKSASPRPLSEALGHFFFSLLQTFFRHSALTGSDIDKRFFASKRRRNGEYPVRFTFFDFDLWASEESDKVENYRFLETGPYDFGENRFARATLDAFSSPVIKISEKPAIRQLSVFALCRVDGSDFNVELGVIGPSEIKGDFRFETRPRTSG